MVSCTHDKILEELYEKYGGKCKDNAVVPRDEADWWQFPGCPEGLVVRNSFGAVL